MKSIKKRQNIRIYADKFIIRTKTHLPGHILVDRGQTIPFCVRDLSATGACLEVASTFGLKNEMALSFNGQRHWGKIAWQTSSCIGVRFT